MSHPPPAPPQGLPKLSPPVVGSLPTSNAAPSNYRSNPMSVSSMLSGPSPFPAPSASHGRSYSDSHGGGNLLPPFGGNYGHKERLFSGPDNARTNATTGAKASGGEREPDKGRSEYIPTLTTPGERSYPPLPSAFARESPYSTGLPDQAALNAHREDDRRRSAISPRQQSAPRPSLPPNNSNSNSSSSAHFSSHAAHHLARPLPLSNPLHHSPLPPVRPPQQQPSQHKQSHEQHHSQRERESKPPATNYSSWTPHTSHSSTLPLRSEFSNKPHDLPPPRTTLDHEPLSRIPPYSHRSPNQQPSPASLPRPSIPQQQQQQQHQQGHRHPESTSFFHPSNGSAPTNHPRHPQPSDRAPPAHSHPTEEVRFVAPSIPGSATATASGMSIPKFQRDSLRERERSRERELPREREQQMRWEPNKATPSPTVHSHTHKRKRSEVVPTSILPPAPTTAPLADLPPPPPPPHISVPAVIPPFQPPHPPVVNPVNGSVPVEGRSTVVKAPPPKRTTALFTLAEQRKGEVRSSMIRVKNEAVLQAIVPKSYDDPPLFVPIASPTPSSTTESTSASIKRPHLGRVIYTPFVNPATLVDGEVLKNNVGGSIEVVIDIGWLDGVGFELGDPELFEGNFLADDAELSFPLTTKPIALVEGSKVVVNGGESKEVEGGGEGEKSIFDLAPLSRRKIWGTDVYTDDSDLLCICLHSGWLRLLPPSSIPPPSTNSTSPSTSAIAGSTLMELDSTTPVGKEKFAIVVGEKRSGSIIVRMVVAPTLLRYQSSIRQSLKSRNWGNGHDGVSLMIESIAFVNERIKPQGIAYTKSLTGEFSRTFIRSSSSSSLSTISPASTTPSHLIDDDSPDHLAPEINLAENGNGNGAGKMMIMVDATTVDGGDNGDDLAAKLIGCEASFILKAQGKNVLLIHQNA